MSKPLVGFADFLNALPPLRGSQDDNPSQAKESDPSVVGLYSYAASNDDRRVRRGDLTTLIVVSSVRLAEWYQRAFDPRVIRFTSAGAPTPAIQARAILVVAERDSETNLKQFQEYLDHIRCRLAPECTDNFFII